MHEVGRLWETAQISMAQEHLSTQITRAVMAALALHLETTATVSPQRVAVVSTSPGEMHALGGQIVADFLEAQGWSVLNLGPDTPVEGLVQLTRERNADLVALSTKLSSHLLSVTRTCQLLRQLPNPPYIVAGGRAYGGDAAQALAVGADSFCDDPHQLLDLLGQRFGRDAPD
jgi:methanogenic corrinoid protein MtbC1